MKYSEITEKITSRKTEKDDITIEPVKDALDELDHPEEDYSVVLVGGTNGKGSTVEMVSELLQHQGNDVGAFKSPHLTSLRERIRINGKKIARNKVVELFSEIDSPEQELSFFEFITVMAYLYFSKQKVDYAVIEVGMGGRLDATNAAEPDLSIITNVGLDHTQYLGDALEEIAREKAGIIPRNGKLVTREDLEPINETADKRETQIIELAEVEVPETGDYRFEGQEFRISVSGSFQKQNLENSLTAVRELGELPDDIGKALSDLGCPGRMETISEDPEVILDGAHNPAALETIIEDLPEDFVCVFNSIETKNSSEMIQIIEEKASRFVFTESEIEWSSDSAELEKNCSSPSEIIKDPVEAVRKAAKYGDPVVVTGSLYLIGQLKKHDIDVKPKVHAEET